MPTAQDTATTVKVGVLRRSLISVAAAAAETDNTTFLLDRIVVEAGGGVLVMTATNRLIAAHARCEADGSLREFGLSIAATKALLFHLRGLKPLLEVSMKLDDRLVVNLPDAELRLPLADLTSYPKMAKIFEPLPLELDLADAAAFDLSTSVLSRLNRILSTADAGAPTHWYRSQQTKPIMVEVDDWLTVAVMPMRRREPGLPARVPFGVPVPVAIKPARKRAAAKAIVAAPAKTTRRRAS